MAMAPYSPAFMSVKKSSKKGRKSGMKGGCGKR